MRGKQHWPPKCAVRPPFPLFACLATTQQRLVTSPRDPGIVSLHVNAGHFSTTARRVTSPTWGPPPPCKQALSIFVWLFVDYELSFFCLVRRTWRKRKSWEKKRPREIKGTEEQVSPRRFLFASRTTDKAKEGLLVV